MASNDYSLVVGIDNYPGLTCLAGAEADARDFHRWVTTTGGVPPENAGLVVTSGFPATVAADARPACQEVWDFVERVRAAAAANNAAGNGLVAGRRVYLFFSGHGFSPSLDASGVLMANAERDAPHNVSVKAWADRFYENGLFEEVILFQDACREPVSDADLAPPYLRRSPLGNAGDRKRFYAFAAKSPLLAVEKPINGGTRGVFSATLMAGLDGGARDPRTGEITAAQLKAYLVSNMGARLDAAELADEDISKRPEVFDLDPFVIAPATAGALQRFPVEVSLAPPGAGARILDGTRSVAATVDAGVPAWRTELPVGLYELESPGRPNALFKVSGALDAHGNPEVVHV